VANAPLNPMNELFYSFRLVPFWTKRLLNPEGQAWLERMSHGQPLYVQAHQRTIRGIF